MDEAHVAKYCLEKAAVSKYKNKFISSIRVSINVLKGTVPDSFLKTVLTSHYMFGWVLDVIKTNV